MNIKALNRKTIAWAFYDWANSAFALSVLAVLFPLVLGNYWSIGDDGPAVTARLGWITFAASVIVCVTPPLFGTIEDAGQAVMGRALFEFGIQLLKCGGCHVERGGKFA